MRHAGRRIRRLLDARDSRAASVWDRGPARRLRGAARDDRGTGGRPSSLCWSWRSRSHGSADAVFSGRDWEGLREDLFGHRNHLRRGLRAVAMIGHLRLSPDWTLLFVGFGSAFAMLATEALVASQFGNTYGTAVSV